jgi:hypothetical protein
MVEGNSLRDQVKDTIRERLVKNGIDQGKANEMTYDMVDDIFDTLAVPIEYQDKNYEHELTELINFYEARESF